MSSSGKTYLSNALCLSAIRQLKTVRYIRASILMLELEQARLKSEYLEYVTGLSKLTFWPLMILASWILIWTSAGICLK